MTPNDLAPFVDRRQRFAASLGEGIAVVPAASEASRNSDVSYEFRQDSDFFFLTGFDEPDAVAVFNPAHAKERYVLFVRPRDREQEIWTGRRAGVEGAIATYGADAAYTADRLDEKLREWLLDRPALYYRLGNAAYDARVTRLVAELRGARARGFTPPVRIEDPGPLVHGVQREPFPDQDGPGSRAEQSVHRVGSVRRVLRRRWRGGAVVSAPFAQGDGRSARGGDRRRRAIGRRARDGRLPGPY